MNTIFHCTTLSFFLSSSLVFSHFLLLAIDAMTNGTVQAAAEWTSCNDSVMLCQGLLTSL